jgi:RecA/RadA recombinase
VPRNALTLLSGRSTSGKLTLAYKTLACASRAGTTQPLVGVMDLSRATDPDYLARCGVQLKQLVLARPESSAQAAELALSLVQHARKHNIVALLIDDINSLMEHAVAQAQFGPQLAGLAARSGCAVIALDEARSAWQRLFRDNAIQQNSALHIELKREAWLERDGELTGYRARAEVVKSRWARGQQSALIAIEFNGTVQARDTW